MAERRRYDLKYLWHRSASLNLKKIVKTVTLVTRQSNILG
jgi:lipopolysaccharide/colanic/teichoic acid biosynthesis glycosyltransferase